MVMSRLTGHFAGTVFRSPPHGEIDDCLNNLPTPGFEESNCAGEPERRSRQTYLPPNRTSHNFV